MRLTRTLSSLGRLMPMIVLILSLFSCVENRKILYLQKPKLNKGEYPSDSIIRTYELQYKEYTIRPGDIITIRVGSITPEEYNFIKEYEEQLGEIRKLYQYQTLPTTPQATGAQGAQQQGGIAAGALRTGTEDGTFSSILLDRYRTGFVVDRKGELVLPKIGVLNLTGLTLEEAEDMIEDKLEGYFETPIVRIQLLSFTFTILGEVKNEGRYIALEPRFNIFDAFMMSGNLTEFADRDNIKIVRHQENDASVIYINPLAEDMLEAKNYYLQPGDMIVVPPLRARYWRRYVIPDTNTALAIITAAVSLFLLIETLRQ